MLQTLVRMVLVIGLIDIAVPASAETRWQREMRVATMDFGDMHHGTERRTSAPYPHGTWTLDDLPPWLQLLDQRGNLIQIDPFTRRVHFELAVHF